MVPFYGWGSTASRLVPGSLLFSTKFPDIPGTPGKNFETITLASFVLFIDNWMVLFVT